MYARSLSEARPVPGRQLERYTLLEKARVFFELETTDYLHASVDRQRVTYRLHTSLAKSGYEYVYLDFTNPSQPVLTGHATTLRGVHHGHSAVY
jgi:hypothetical protein